LLFGLLVPSKDAAALAGAIGRLVEDASLRRSLGQAGRDYVASHYDWRENIAQMEAIYAGAGSGRGSKVAVL